MDKVMQKLQQKKKIVERKREFEMVMTDAEFAILSKKAQLIDVTLGELIKSYLDEAGAYKQMENTKKKVIKKSEKIDEENEGNEV